MTQTISLRPVPWEKLEGLSDRERSLQCIGDVVAHWLRWTSEAHAAEDIPVSGDTAIILGGENKPPVWPNVAQLTRWLEVIREPVTSSDAEA